MMMRWNRTLLSKSRLLPVAPLAARHSTILHVATSAAQDSFIPTRRYACSAPPELPASIVSTPPRRCTCSSPPEP